jgi:hypothetical protein
MEVPMPAYTYLVELVEVLFAVLPLENLAWAPRDFALVAVAISNLILADAIRRSDR